MILCQIRKIYLVLFKFYYYFIN